MSRKRTASLWEEEQVRLDRRPCDIPNCAGEGAYRAPKGRDRLTDYFWFCLDHVRQFNQKWNFFDNHSEEELERQFAADKVWDRPTKPFSNGKGNASAEARAWARLGIDDPHELLGENATQNPGRGDGLGLGRKLPAAERKSLDILEAREDWTKPELRKQYKKLIKELHPDLNGGDRTQEERLQQVVWAWDQIKDSRNFKA